MPGRARNRNRAPQHVVLRDGSKGEPTVEVLHRRVWL
jgi:hypothetical protein